MLKEERTMMLFLLAGVLVIFLTPATGFSVTFTVNSTADAVDANPGDGACATAGGVCTLRAAIQEVNALFSSPTNTLILSSGTYTLSITGKGEDAAATGDLDIVNNVSIIGAGAGATVIDGALLDRVLEIGPYNPGITVSISGVTIKNGDLSSGGIGGAVLNRATLTLTNVTVSNSSVTFGGGIFNTNGATLTLDYVTVNNNTAVGLGAGIYEDNNATATISNSVISGNTATDSGGGIYNASGGTITIDNSAVSGNSAQAGGGIFNNDGTLTVTDSIINANTAAPSSAGGIWNNGSMTLTNVTVSGNSTAETGGGIGSFATSTLTNVTITGNTANSDNAGGEPGGGIAVLSGTVNVKNSIIAGNAVGTGSTSPDCFGTLISQGYNLIQNTTGCTISGVTTGNITGQNPQLGALANNGGPTQTHALLTGSPAIDAGTNTGCPATDQRGISRPKDGNNDSIAVCDMGAYELQPIPTNNPPSTPTLVFPANGQTGLGTTVTFRWKKSTDPDGDALTYHLYNCTDQSFAGCSPVNVASAAPKSAYFAGFGWLGLLLISLVLAGSVKGRKRLALLILVVVMITGGILASCGGGGGGGEEGVPADEMSHTASGLNSGATYYWKVVADDNKGGTAVSAVWSFTTQ